MSENCPAMKERIFPGPPDRSPMCKETLPDAGFGRPILASPMAADPTSLAKRDLKKALPRRFYKEAKAGEREGVYVLLLDGRTAKTAGGNPIALPSLAGAEAIAEEWSPQGEWIDWAQMPITRMANSAIDGVSRDLSATVDEIAKYAGSDLVCYRAAEPRRLVEAQAAAWDPILAFARKKIGAVFICTEGVMFVEQPQAARTAVTDAVACYTQTGAAAPFALAALHVMTTLTASVLIALGVAHGALSPTEAWRAAHVDEDFEIEAWGEDAEALERRERQWREFEAAARLFQSVQSRCAQG
jgi:chaperone required for assembly of F1-ATPase